jgi:hypothetical protein
MTTYDSYCTVIPDERSNTGALLVAARTGCIIQRTRLGARTYAAARAEAQAMYPDREVIIPMEGQKTP